MSSFQVGDVVIKVTGRYAGLIGRVTGLDFWPGGKGVPPCDVLHLEKPHPETPNRHGWVAKNFRKLPKADEQFTEQMRALKPKKVVA